ncbi:MAG: histone-like nucleoid-structuring protein Lsr2 [Dermatophilaceae bacterium]
MKITIDSSEPLTDAIRVVGALYNVSLTQANESTGVREDGGGLSVTRGYARPNGKPATPTRRQAPRPPAQKPVRAPVAATRRKSAAKAADPGEIRAWAKANGHTVNDRGPLPGALRAAFAAAQSV